jgi:hypothetical protein
MLWFVFFLALNALCFSSTTNDLPGAEEVEKQVIAYRHTLKTAEVKLSQATYSKESGSPSYKQTTKIWFEGNKLRNDLELRRSPEEPFHREIHGRHCEREGFQLYYTEEKSPGEAFPLEFHQLRPDTDPLSFPVIDPRLMGLAICRSCDLPLAHFEKWVHPSNRQPPSIRKTSLAGKELLLVEYTFLQGARVRMWIAPDLGPSIVRMESEYVKGGKPHLHSLVCDFADSPVDSYWYPKTCTYQFMIEGKIETKEIANIEITSLNKPLPPEVFTLAGMGIAKDTVITGLPRVDKTDGLPTWNGEAVLTPKMPAVPLAPLATPPAWRRPLLLAGSLALALMAAVLVWHFLLRKKPA